jgi:hypothetical protein
MWLFYFFVRVQRYVALSPRLSFIPKKGSQAVSETATATF